MTEVVCENFQLLESRSAQNNTGQAQTSGEGNYPSNQNNTFKPQDNSQEKLFDDKRPPQVSDSFSSSQSIDIADDDLPF